MNISEDIIDIGNATGIYDLRRLKIKYYAELVVAARSMLDFCHSITPNVQMTAFDSPYTTPLTHCLTHHSNQFICR